MRKLILLFIISATFSSNVFGARKEFFQEKEYSVIRVEIYSNGNLINYDSNDEKVELPFVFIDNTPKMPDIKIKFCPDDSTFYKIKFKLKVDYHVNITQTYDLNCDGILDVKKRDDIDIFPNTDGNSLNEEWQIIEFNESKVWDVNFNGYFCGGKATVTWEAFSKDGKKVFNGEEIFYIRGENPTVADAESYVSDRRWYYKPLIRHEARGNYHQFNPRGTHFGPAETDFDCCPVWGGPDGWGMMQLEIAARRNALTTNKKSENGRRGQQLLWNWQDNVDAGILWLEDECRDHAERKMREYLRDAQKVVDGGIIDAIPEITMEILKDKYGSVTFLDSRVHPNARFTFIDALAIKRYNGIGGGNFISWNSIKNCWKANEMNKLDPAFNYVKLVCLEY